MKKITFCAITLMTSIFSVQAQLYTPSGTILGNSLNSNIGIGTNSPADKLSISGSLSLNSGLTNSSIRPIITSNTLLYGEIRSYSSEGNLYDDGFLRLSAGGGTSTFTKSYIDLSGYSTQPDMSRNIVFGTSGKEQMRIDINGNIGIGIPNPSAKLETYNTIPGVTSFKTVGLNGYLLVDNIGSGENYYYAKNFHEFQVGETSKMRINYNGNVGIGTTTPNSRLDLGTGYGTKGAKLLIYNDDPTNELSGTKCGFYMDNFKSNNLNLVFPEAVNHPGLFTISAKNTSDTTLKPYFSIAGLTGNIGIGTTNPDEKLTVNGKIHAQEVKIDLAYPMTVPDYVFANDYKLKSLQEVEEFIKQNSHLPEIPSAKEIEKNGLMLAEMNMSLLKKIEELTLYTIEQEKKNNEQSREIETLKKENEGFKSLSERLTKIENQIK
jgi:hypothetical protein